MHCFRIAGSLSACQTLSRIAAMRYSPDISMEERSFFGRKILGASRRRSLYINKYSDMGKRGRTGSVPWIRHSFVLGPHLERSGGRQNAFVAFRGTRITRARRGAFSGFYPIYPAIRLPEFSELTQRAS